jgi:hypothetical protein
MSGHSRNNFAVNSGWANQNYSISIPSVRTAMRRLLAGTIIDEQSGLIGVISNSRMCSERAVSVIVRQSKDFPSAIKYQKRSADCPAQYNFELLGNSILIEIDDAFGWWLTFEPCHQFILSCIFKVIPMHNPPINQ